MKISNFLILIIIVVFHILLPSVECGRTKKQVEPQARSIKEFFAPLPSPDGTNNSGGKKDESHNSTGNDGSSSTYQPPKVPINWKPNETRGRKPRRKKQKLTSKKPSVVIMKKRIYQRWSLETKVAALDYCDHLQLGLRDLTRAVDLLALNFPSIFGKKDHPLSRPTLSDWMKNKEGIRMKFNNLTIKEKILEKHPGGRPPVLPLELREKLIKTLHSVIITSSYNFTIGLLRPVALAVVASSGFGHLLKEKVNKLDFCLSHKYLVRLCHEQNWRFKASFGDAKKIPNDWEQLSRSFCLRVAYFKFIYDIPNDLIVNFDHTPVHFIQMRVIYY
jgi:hypothetical protein